MQMKRVLVAFALMVALLAAAPVSGAVSGGGVPSLSVAPAAGAGASGQKGSTAHVKALPKFVQKKEKERLVAADLVVRGQATVDAAGVVTLKNGKRVQYRQQGEAYLTVVLVDFADLAHGNIPKPDRTKDNATYWPGDVSPQHYRDMLFSDGGASYGFPSMRDYYTELSSGRFTWTGQVSNWVTVPETAAGYGANSRSGGAGSDDLNGDSNRIVDHALKAVAANG
jgi:immune inhibitor A